MKRDLLHGAFASVFVMAGIWAHGARAQSPDHYVPRQIIVRLDPAAPPGDAMALRQRFHAVVKARFENIGAELWEIAGTDVPSAVDGIKRDSHIDYAEPNYIIRAADIFPNDPYFDQLWGLHNVGQAAGTPDADIDAPAAWGEATGATTLIGVVDTGVDWHHVDLAANIFTNAGEIPDNGIDDDGNGFVDDVHGWDFINDDNDPIDDSGHGTHVAGIIAARGNNATGVVGVSWSARILPIKILGADGRGTVAEAVLGIEYATKMGVRLTNNSWGGNGISSALRAAITEAGSRGMLFVAAAGNSGANSDVYPIYPAAYDLDNIISVASTSRNDVSAATSNYGPVSVDLAAPGINILSTLPNDTYGALSGTSMAAAFVSGAAALAWARAPLLTHTEVRNAILSSADPLTSLAGTSATGARLNVGRMLSGFDANAPIAVGNLAVESAGSSFARLTWMAGGDDGTAGTARSYDLRYARTPITANTFNAATRVPGMPPPQSAGSFESAEITGLGFYATYYFALVVEDEAGNRSPISNIASTTTLGVPRIEAAPGSFSANLKTGGTRTQLLTLENTGAGMLDFALQSSPAWARLDPPSGRVAAGQSVQVKVVLDAARMSSGGYSSSLIVATNDPAGASVALPVVLQVTNAPDIAASLRVIDFGPGFGPCAINNLEISNIGTALLTVSGAAVDDTPFFTLTSPFLLGPDETRSIPVGFCPGVSPGRFTGTLTIASNDPDEPAYTVSLKGRTVDPPVMSVNTASISASVFTGGVATRTLAISNPGGSNLDFEISIEGTGVDAAQTFGGASSSPSDVRGVGRPLSPDQLRTLRSAIPQRVSVGTPGVIDRGTTPVKRAGGSAALGSMSGARVEEVFGSAANQFIGGPRTRGNLFTCTKSTTLLEHRLYLEPIASSQMWFLVYEGVNPDGIYLLVSASDMSPSGIGLGWYSSGDVHVSLSAGLYYLIVTSFETSASYFTQDSISPFPIPASFGTLTAGAGWTWTPTVAFPPDSFQEVTPEAFDQPVAYYQTLVTDGGVKWVTLAPESKTLGRGGSMNVTVRIDAAGLPDGDHEATLRVTGNDPLTPEAVVPVHLHVASAAHVGVARTHIDFGDCFVGSTVTDTLVVSNGGTKPLHVTGIAASQPKYAVDLPAFTLPPNANINVAVTFAPGTTGSFPGTLTLTCDDPDQPVVVVDVAGHGVEPPVMVMSPSFFSQGLTGDGTASRTLSLTNAGASDLYFRIEVETADGPAPPGPRAGPVKRREQAALRGIAPTRLAGLSYSGHRAGSRTGELAAPRPAASSGSSLRVLILKNAPVAEIRGLLTVFPDIAVVDEFDASTSVPTVDALVQYDAVLVINDAPFGDPFGVGDVLADYVDHGGGVVVTLASFITGFEMSGRFLSGGYDPFELGSGPNGSAALGVYDPAHPIMEGVQSVAGDLLGATALRPGARWVADWDDESPFIATQGEHVVGINALISDGGYWLGDIPLIVHNALAFVAGKGWLVASPAVGVIPAHGTLAVALTLDASGLEYGAYHGTIRVAGNDPRHPAIVIPVALEVDSTVLSAAGPAPVPTRYALFSNRPNPFNPTTTIAYDLPRNVDVRLVVYDVGGRQVRELVRAARPAGRHSVVWDGRDDKNGPVASGVYFYRLSAGDFVQTRKMVLLK